MHEELSGILRDMHNQDTPEQEPETLHIYHVDGGILILRENNVVESDASIEPDTTLPPLANIGWFERNVFTVFIFVLCLFLLIDSFSSYLPTVLASTATIVITPDQQNITLKTDIGLESIHTRTLPALTLSQNETVRATGKGHQNASYATGSITFYNGLLTAQTIPAGTVLIGSDGITVVTTQDAYITPANPPTEGQTTVSARALQIGSQGNIGAKDIDTACCVTSVLAVNSSAFQRGQDARDFTYVTKQDIQNAFTPIEKTVSQSLQSALTSQLTSQESLLPLTCKPIIRSDHQVGDEVATVTVTVSESCSAIAYTTRAVQDRAVHVIQTHAEQVLGMDYMLFGSIRTNIISTTRTTIALSIQGVWMYKVNEQHVKQLIAGTSEKEAIRLLSSLSGVKQVTIMGIPGNSSLPTDANHIHVFILL